MSGSRTLAGAWPLSPGDRRTRNPYESEIGTEGLLVIRKGAALNVHWNSASILLGYSPRLAVSHLYDTTVMLNPTISFWRAWRCSAIYKTD